MPNKIKVITIVSLVLGCITTVWLIYDFLVFSYLKPKMVALQDIGEPGELLTIFLGVGLVVSFIFHISSILAILLQMRLFRRADVFRALALFTGVISCLLLRSDFALLGDIFKEYKHGMVDVGEWNVLYINHTIHGIFLIMTVLLNVNAILKLKSYLGSENIVKEESVYLAAQYIGIACGVMGLSMFLLNYLLHLPLHLFKGLSITLSGVVLAPYCLIVIYWFLIKRKEKVGEWYDEKQFTDVAKSSLNTMAASIPCMAIVFALPVLGIESILSALWFPFYVFVSLLLFSGSALYYSARG
ncbi:hypothetical protein ACFL5K_02420 [Gemmatimonadota bacterium]